MAPHTVYLEIPDDIYEELTRRADEYIFGPKSRRLLFTVLRQALAAKTPPDTSPAGQTDAECGSGYQWKQLFLPDGTLLRQTFEGASHFARVVGEKVLCGDAAVTPSQFANLQGAGNRNAWQVIWLRFPGCADWRHANQCRPPRQR